MNLIDARHLVGDAGDQGLLKLCFVVCPVIKGASVVFGEAMFGTMASATTTCGVAEQEFMFTGTTSLLLFGFVGVVEVVEFCGCSRCGFWLHDLQKMGREKVDGMEGGEHVGCCDSHGGEA